MNNLSYRVYSSFMGWNLIGIKQEIPQVIELIETKIKEEVNAQYLIIGIEDLLIFKEEYKEENNIEQRIKRK